VTKLAIISPSESIVSLRLDRIRDINGELRSIASRRIPEYRNAMDMTHTRSDDPEFNFERLRARVPPRPPEWMMRKLVVVPVVVGINVVVFLLWQLANFLPAIRDLMATNFLTGWPLLKAGYFWTLLTSEFSHYEWWHIGINMLVLWSFGAILERLLGARKFLEFYLVAAVVASLSHCLTSVMIGRPQTMALGASGAISGLLILYALIFPKHKILVFGIIPVPAMAGALAFVGLDVWGLIAQSRGGGLPIGHGAHLGGALCGALYFYFSIRGKLQQPGPRPSGPGLSMSEDEARRFDEIRNRLSVEGPDGLSDEQREFLEEIRRRVFPGHRGG